MDENVFDYDLNILEIEVINPCYMDKALYLQTTPEIKRLSDLHLLFLIRRDKENCNRIMEMIRNIEGKVESISYIG